MFMYVLFSKVCNRLSQGEKWEYSSLVEMAKHLLSLS